MEANYKLTDLGMRPIWRVTTRQPYVVPNLRKSLEKQAGGVYSGDIPFLNRLFLDLDLSMHIHAQGEIIDTIDVPNNEMQQTTKVRAAGGAGRYSVDITVACIIDELSETDAFQVPFKVFSFDLETSIKDGIALVRSGMD